MDARTLLESYGVFLGELENRMVKPFKYEYTKEHGRQSGQPREPRTHEERISQDRCRSYIISKLESLHNEVELFARTQGVPFTFPHVFSSGMSNILYYNPSLRSLDTVITISQKILHTLQVLESSSQCAGLPRIQNLFQKNHILEFLSKLYKISSGLPLGSTEPNVVDMKIRIKEPEVRHLMGLFGRCGRQGLEMYIRRILTGDKSKTFVPPVFDYESFPFLERKGASVNRPIYEKSLRNFPADFERTYTLFSNQENNTQRLFEEFRTHGNFNRLSSEITAGNSQFPKDFLKMMKDNILNQNIQYSQGFDTMAFDLIQLIPNKANDLFLLYLKKYNIPYEKYKTIFYGMFDILLQMVDSTKFVKFEKLEWMFKDMTRNVIIGNLAQKSFSTPYIHDSKVYFIQKTIRTILYDLLFRTSPLFTLYFCSVIFKYYFNDFSEDNIGENLKILFYKFSENQIQYAMKMNGVKDSSVEKYEKSIEADESLTFADRVRTLHLFDDDSPFRNLLKETMELMLHVLPTELVQQSIRELKEKGEASENIGEFLRTQHHLIHDPYAITNMYTFIHASLQDHLENPLRYGFLDKKCMTGLFVGVKGKPKQCSTADEYTQYIGCLKALQSSLQSVNRQQFALEYTTHDTSVVEYQIFISRFAKLIADLKSSENCLGLDRILEFSKNQGTYNAGDLVFFNRLVSSYPPLGGARRAKTCRQKRLRRTLKRR